jgi:hypothetical protein
MSAPGTHVCGGTLSFAAALDRDVMLLGRQSRNLQ